MDALKPIYGSLRSKESLISGKKWESKINPRTYENVIYD